MNTGLGSTAKGKGEHHNIFSLSAGTAATFIDCVFDTNKDTPLVSAIGSAKDADETRTHVEFKKGAGSGCDIKSNTAAEPLIMLSALATMVASDTKFTSNSNSATAVADTIYLDSMISVHDSFFSMKDCTFTSNSGNKGGVF